MLPHLAGANTSTTLGPLQTTTFFGAHSACLAVLVFLLSEAERPRLGQNGPEELRQKPKAVGFKDHPFRSKAPPHGTPSARWPL